MQTHVVALPLSDTLYQQLNQLSLRFDGGEKQPLAEEMGKLLGEVGCEVIEQVFGSLIKKFAEAATVPPHNRQVFEQSVAHIAQVQAVMRKYMGFGLSWFNNARLQPVLTYLMQQIQPHPLTAQAPQPGQLAMSPPLCSSQALIFELPASLAGQAYKALAALSSTPADSPPAHPDAKGNGTGKSIAEAAAETLIEITDLGVSRLIREPKNLLKFNYVVDKTLNGIMKVTTSMGYQQLRQFARQLDPQLYSTFAQHLQPFIHSTSNHRQ